jgi:dolichol kinase
VSTVVAVAVLVAWQSFVELLKRRVPASKTELPRKLVHVGSGLITAALPFFLSYGTIGALAVAFAGGMAISRRLRIFTAVHCAGRTSYGEIFYPLGIALLAAIHPSRGAFVYAVLVLALADGFAALVGSHMRRGRLPWGKSVPGSATFFLIAGAVGVAVLAPDGVSPGTAIATALVAAAALTLTELVLRLGLDNLVLPPVAALVIAVRVDPRPIAQAAWLIAPVVLAGVVHSVVIHRDLAPRLARPIDGGRTLRGRRLFGSNKTWRGVVVMSTTTAVGALVLFAIAPRSLELPLRAEGVGAFLLLGSVLGIAYSLAELPNSFVKRQLGIAPGARTRSHGRSQYLVDQLDSVLGVAAVLAIAVDEPAVLLAIVPLGLAVHAVADYLLYALRVKAPVGDVVAAAPAEALA